MHLGMDEARGRHAESARNGNGGGVHKNLACQTDRLVHFARVAERTHRLFPEVFAGQRHGLFPVQFAVYAVINGNVGQLIFLLIFLNNYRETRRLGEQLSATERAATTDPLTGVKNRTAYDDMSETLTSRSRTGIASGTRSPSSV